VRYGNVLASTGSVVPFFKSKIANGEPVPLTHPEMTRFIISVNQAVELILKALLYSIGGEVIVPSLPSARMVDLIAVLKDAANADNEVVEIGIRPGEKIHEVLINDLEMRHTYKFQDIYVIESMIAEYQREVPIAAYKADGKHMSESSMVNYSSKDHLISRDALKDLLIDFDLLCGT
jgi:UDP-N-acetylglucosamine 4,6-dehydratase